MPGDVSGPNPPSSGAPPVRTTGGSALWTPPSPEHLQRLLPQYEILSMIGRGGMGAVYKGRQISLDRFVAIKILPPEALEGDETADFAERFKNEARSMARMNHPAIVGVYDFGETSEGQLFIVMEYVDATDVAQMIKSQGRLPPEHALAITAHVCDALQYAHSRGVIHRDIKPANVLMSMEGRVKIADFGLAKATDPDALAITKTNMAMGTPDFIAPEALITGLLVDHRADLYAVGVMLYNMLTGRIPRGVFTPASKLAGSDPRYDGIVTKAMQTEREERYQSATELRRDLDVILTVPMAKPESASQRRAPPAVARKPVARSPQSSNGGASAVAQGARAPDGRSAVPPKKTSAGMIAGIIGTAAVILAGAFFALKKPASTGPSDALARGLESLPAEEQVKRVVARLKELNPGFDGKETHKIRDGKVVELRLGEATDDLSPLSALKDLEVLSCPGRSKGQKAKSLSPLKGLPLTQIDLHNTYLSDLSPLAGMKLKKLEMGFTQVKDLSPLKGMPLEDLTMNNCIVTDLSALRGLRLKRLGFGGWDSTISDLTPLKDMPLTDLRLGNTAVNDLSALRGLPLTSLSFSNTPVSDLSPLRGMPLKKLSCEKTRVTDFSPLRDLPLEELTCDFVASRDTEILQSIKTLKRINGKPVGEFWKGSEGSVAPPGVTPPSRTARQTLDLLALTDPVQDRVPAPSVGKNEWARSGAAVVFTDDGKAGMLAAPVACNCRDYEIELLVERRSDVGYLNMDVPLGKGRILPVRLNLPGGKVINDKEGKAWGASASMIHVSVQVRLSDDGLSDRIVIQRKDNGEGLADWTGDSSSLGKPAQPHPVFPGQPVTAIYVGKDPYAVKAWTLRVFEGEAKVLRESGASVAGGDAPKSAPASSGVVNLITGLDVTRATVEGKWSLKNGELNGGGATYARLAFDHQPQEEYDFRIRFTRTGGSNAVSQHVALAGHDVMWLMGGFNNSVCAFELVRGAAGKDNPTTVKSGIENGRQYESVLKVRRDRVQVDLDGKQVADYKTDGSDLGVNSRWAFPDPTRLGIGCQTDTVFHSIEVIPVAAVPDPKLASLLRLYTTNVDKAAASASTGDKVAFQGELARLKNNELPPPTDDPKLPAELVRLRKILREQMRK